MPLLGGLRVQVNTASQLDGQRASIPTIYLVLWSLPRHSPDVVSTLAPGPRLAVGIPRVCRLSVTLVRPNRMQCVWNRIKGDTKKCPSGLRNLVRFLVVFRC